MNVVNRDCPSNFPSPPSSLVCKGQSRHCSQSCHPPAGGSALSRAELNTCNVGCVDANNECNACYIWLSSLCGCIQQLQQGKQTTCLPSASITSGKSTPPVWMVNSAHDLMVPTYQIPGILQLYKIPNYVSGFNFGQHTVWTMYKKDGTLSVNSVVGRTAEQLHVHLCKNPNSKVRGILDGLNHAQYKSLAPIDLKKVHSGWAMECRVASASGANIDQGGDIINHLQQLDKSQGHDNCAQYHVGSGYMVDTKGFAWSCVTTTGSAEELFCHL